MSYGRAPSSWQAERSQLGTGQGELEPALHDRVVTSARA